MNAYSTSWPLAPLVRGFAYALLAFVLHMMGGWQLVALGNWIISSLPS